ncbi:MAG: DNA recombination protein RmuC, partial [uncultured Blastococcus sp.]
GRRFPAHRSPPGRAAGHRRHPRRGRDAHPTATRGHRTRTGARVAGPPAPTAGRHGARPRHRARRAAGADGHGRPDLGAAQARDRRAGHRPAHAARPRAVGRGAAAPGGRGRRPGRALRLRRAAERHQRRGRRRPARPDRHPLRRAAGGRRRQGAVHRLHRGGAGDRGGGAGAADRDARPAAARPHRRALGPPLPDGVPARGPVHGAVRPVRRVPHDRTGGRARPAGVRVLPRRRPGHAQHPAGTAAHRRLLLAAGAAGPRRRPGARSRPPAARAAQHPVGAPHPAGLRTGHDHDPVQRDRRILRALGADGGPPVRRPGHRRHPGAHARARGGDGAHPAPGRAGNRRAVRPPLRRRGEPRRHDRL